MTDFVIRDDIRVKPYAVSKGFTPEVDKNGYWKENVPFNPYSYEQSNNSINPTFSSVRVWYCRKGWAVAKLSLLTDDCPTGRFYDHEYKDTPEDAIKLAYSWLPKNYAIAIVGNGTTYLEDINGETARYTLPEARKQIELLKQGNEPTNIEYILVQQYE